MNKYVWRIVYSWCVAPLIGVIVHVLALKNQNLKAGLKGRKGLWQRLDKQLAHRTPEKPLIWFHVASAGEFLQAQPVLERCWQHGYECAVTFTSVNGYKWVQRTTFPKGQNPVVKEYLPLDTVSNMRRLLNALRPAAIVYVKYDLWPNLVWQAYAAEIPQYLISASLQPKSKRLTSAIGRSLYHTLYTCLDGIFAGTEEDRQRFLSTNPDHPNIRVVGNTGFDIVLDRKKRIPHPKLPNSITEKFVFIAGSTWPPDEKCIFPALKEALQKYPDFFVIIAPHEPTEDHLRYSESFFKDFFLKRFTTLQEQLDRSERHAASLHDSLHSLRIILIDTIGVLSSIYSAGTCAYVGGAFTTGVHNVMEPAAMGMPVCFGPQHYNSPEALDLVKRGLAFAITTPEEFRAQLFEFLHDPDTCQRLGQQALYVIESQSGAADRCFQLIRKNIEWKKHTKQR